MPISLIAESCTFTSFLRRKIETVNLGLPDTGRMNITPEKRNISKFYSIGILGLFVVSVLNRLCTIRQLNIN